MNSKSGEVESFKQANIEFYHYKSQVKIYIMGTGY